MITLRPDQIAAVDAIVAVKRGIVKAPAGAGKTIIAAAALKKFFAGKTTGRFVWYAHTMEQCAQAFSACQQFGLCGNFVCYQSGIKPDGADIVILDEVHHVAAEEFRKILDGFEGVRWGFSATPEREDDLKDDVFQLVGPIVHTVERAGLVESGKLLGAKVYFHAPNNNCEMKDFVEGEATKGFEKMKYSLDYVAKQIAAREGDSKSWQAFRKEAKIELMSRARWHAAQTYGIFENASRNEDISNLAIKHLAEGDSVLILVGSIEHGKLLADYIGGNAVVVYSKMGAKKRKAAIAGFRDGMIKCVIATSLADEGLDVPRANVLILAGAGRSKGKTEQRTGRVLREWGEQTHGIIHDFWDHQHPLLMNQSRVRAKVYAGLKYEFDGGDGVVSALRAIGIKEHKLLVSTTDEAKDQVIPGVGGERLTKTSLPVPMLAELSRDTVTTSLQDGDNHVDDEQVRESKHPLPFVEQGILTRSNADSRGRQTFFADLENPVFDGPNKNQKSSCGLVQPTVDSATSESLEVTPLNTELKNESSASSQVGVSSQPVVGPASPDPERTHARLSPSTLKAKAICPGFINDPDGDKTAANRGTLGHKAVETNNPGLCGDDAQLRHAVYKCIEYKREVLFGLSPLQYYQEVRFEYFEQWGFCDLVALRGSVASMVDWKFAFNYYEADSPQFWAYCLGAWNRWPQLETIEVHVPHPFLDTVDRNTFTRAQHFDDFQIKIKGIMAWANINDPAQYRISAQCAYCGFAGKCSKLAALGAKIGQAYSGNEITLPEGIDFHGSKIDDPKIIALLYRLAPIIEKAAGGWRKAAVEMYDNGTEIPGYKMAQRKGKRSIASTVEAFKIVKTHFAPHMTPEAFLQHCTVTATGLDELVAATAPKGSKEKTQRELAARLEDADALTFGSGSRFLVPVKEEGESDDV